VVWGLGGDGGVRLELCDGGGEGGMCEKVVD